MGKHKLQNPALHADSGLNYYGNAQPPLTPGETPTIPWVCFKIIG
ncbi:MAG: hypothetical protein ACK4QL_01865 [Pseudanabaenaceae cyanobacterium]